MYVLAARFSVLHGGGSYQGPDFARRGECIKYKI